MIINLKEWQRYLVLDLLHAIPDSVKGPLEESVDILTYIEKQTGDGFYRDKVAYITRGIRHPRLLLERTCHELGHGIEEWLSNNGFLIDPYNSDAIADGFALSILYPYILERDSWKKIKKIYRKAFYPEGFPDIDIEGLIEKYSQIVKVLNSQKMETMGKEVHDRLEDFFNSQSNGFLRKKTAL